MARKPGPLSPEGSGKGSLSLGQSSQGARAVANQRAGAGAAAKAAQAKTKATLANTRLATNKNISVERVFPSGAYRVTDLSTFASKQFMGYTKAQAINLFKKSK